MTSQNGRAFNEWLRAQLKAKKMSQRQLAQQSGVDHSTISRLIRGDRMPSLGTATKLARGLRELRDATHALVGRTADGLPISIPPVPATTSSSSRSSCAGTLWAIRRAGRCTCICPPATARAAGVTR